MGDPINKAPLIAVQTNLVNGEVSDGPILEAAVENLYDYSDTKNAEINAHLAATTLPHADGSVTGPKLAANSVSDPKLATGAILSRSLGTGSVISEKVANQNITEPKMANSSVSSRTIQNQAVKAQHIDPAIFAPYPDTAIWVKFAQIDSQLETGHVKRLKQPLCANTYWIGYTLAQMRTEIDNWIVLGVDGIAVTIHLIYSGPTLVPSENISDVINAINYARGKGVEITCIKVHCTVTAGGSFLTDYQTAVTGLLSTFSGASSRFIILNERLDITDNSSNNAWAISLIGVVKSAGYQCGISLSDNQYYGISDSVLSALDFIGLNCYPIVGYKGRNTTLQDCINGIDVSVVKRMLLDLKVRYPNKPVIITEFGIRNYYIYYASPSDFTYDSPGDIADGQTVLNYFHGLFNVMNGSVDGIWSWFDIYYPSTVDFFQSWTGGGVS